MLLCPPYTSLSPRCWQAKTFSHKFNGDAMMNYKWLTSAAGCLLIGSSLQVVLAQDSSNDIQFKPLQINFGSVSVATCRPRKIEATNLTEAAISNPGFKVIDSGAFRLQSRFKCANPLEPGETCRGYVNFCPPYYEIYKGTLMFTGSDQRVVMTGEGRSSNQE